MDFRQRLSGINGLEWFLILFCFLIVGAAGYALGTQAVVKDTKRVIPGHQSQNKKLVPEQGQTKQPLQAQPSDIQGGSSELPPTGATNPQETNNRPVGDNDLLYPYDPGYCNPRKPTPNRECMDY